MLAIHQGQEDYVYFPLKDNLGSTRVLLETKPDGSGREINPKAAYGYLPYGEEMLMLSAMETSYQYTGQEYEEATDLYNYRARHYAQRRGHFLAPDPQGQFHSPYVYAGNNPVNLVDPDGEIAVLSLGSILGGLYAGYTYKKSYEYSGSRIFAAVNTIMRTTETGMKAAIGAEIGQGIGIGSSASEISGFKEASTFAAKNAALEYGQTMVSTRGDHNTSMKAAGVGFAGSLFNTYGLELMHDDLALRLAHQGLSTAGRSIGMNWAHGRGLFSQVDIGVGPITVPVGGSWGDFGRINAASFTAHGLALIDGIFLGGELEWHGEHLALEVHSGKLSSRWDVPSGAYVVASSGGITKKSTMRHEFIHIWQSRVYGNSFVPLWAFSGLYSYLRGEGFRGSGGLNFIENQAYRNQNIWFKP